MGHRLQVSVAGSNSDEVQADLTGEQQDHLSYVSRVGARAGRRRPPSKVGVVRLSTAVLAGLLTIVCCGPAWENDPNVEGARIACAGLRRTEHADCVEQEAVARLNPDVCHLAGITLDGACLQAVYEAADDPAICAGIYPRESLDKCYAWYAQRTPQPSLVADRWPPRGEHLRGCAPSTARTLADFERALTAERRTFEELCRQLGQPDWQTGSGLIIYVYGLRDGSEVWLGFGSLQRLNYAILVTPDGVRQDLLLE